MRSIRWRGLYLIFVFIFLGGCGDDSDDSKPPSALAYSAADAIYTVAVEITPNKPTHTGGAVTSYSAGPDLPAGLSLSSFTGIITGIPTTASAKTTYKVTASNADGSTATNLTIAVRDGVPAEALPNMGQQITPLAPEGARFEPMTPNEYAPADAGMGLSSNPTWLVGQAATTVVSPDRKTLLVMTSGFNRVFDANGRLNPTDSTEYVFIYDISTGTPVKKQVIKVSNTYYGIAFDPSGEAFYVPGNVTLPADGGLIEDDLVHVYTRNADGTWKQTGLLNLDHIGGGVGLPVPNSGPVPVNSQIYVQSMPAGVAISNDGETLVVANYYNDSITVFTGGFERWVGHLSEGTELDLRPGKSGGESGTPGGEYPFWAVVKGNASNATAYISSIRDREIVVVSLSGAPAITARIAVKGQPNKMTLNAAQSLLYVAEDQTDTVDVIDTTNNQIIETIPVVTPLLPSSLKSYTGANTNSVTLSPDEKQLYVTNGNLNCVAVVALNGTNKDDRVVGLIPTGWYPNSVSFSGDGNTVYVVNGKSPTGPNPGNCYIAGPPTHPGATSCQSANQYNPQLIKAGLQTFPRPTAAQLSALTAQVATNNRFSHTVNRDDKDVMAAVRKGVRHVIFIIKENRTYDQILGDLEIGNGDPDLAEFGEEITPNHHNLARAFVTLDNFYATSEVSNDGWPWTVSARAPDVIEHQVPVCYAGRGLSLDSEGTNRSVNVALATVAERKAANPIYPDDPDLLPGQTNTAAPDGPDNEINTGYVWDAALRAKLTVRNYGFFIDTTVYNLPPPHATPLLRDPASTNTIVAVPSSVSLAPYTDPYFRGFDNAFPDYYRYKEWAREFDTKYADGGLPALSLVRFMHNHTGNFPGGGGAVVGTAAIDGVDTPEEQVADNDYAVGLLIEKIANSKYANDTLIFIIEDDAQDGGDHVDSHRSDAYVVGAYVKQGALVSTQYNTIDFLRTIEEVLGIPPMNLNDAVARPMADIFNTTPSNWSFAAKASAYLYGTDLKQYLPPVPMPKAYNQIAVQPTRNPKYWGRVTKGLDFTSEDLLNGDNYNRILWKGLMGNKPYPDKPTGLDLRQNREELLARYHQSRKLKAKHSQRREIK